MAVQQYGWQDRVGGVEPGFSDKPVPVQFGATRHVAEDRDETPYGAPGTTGRARNEEWLGNLLE